MATRAGTDRGYTSILNPHQWLSEGIAEYIAHAPQPATASARTPAVRRLLASSDRPTTLAIDQLPAGADAQTTDAFYGYGHHAASCLAARYGERKLFEFVTRVFRQDAGYDEAAQAAFGRPFRTVDRACVTAIRRSAG